MTDLVDKVAEAICLNRTEPHRHPTAWRDAGPDLKDHYRRMAQAAIDALELTPEWSAPNNIQPPGLEVFPNNERWVEWVSTQEGAKSRLVSSWVEVMGND